MSKFHESLKSPKRRAADEAARAYLREHPDATWGEVSSRLHRLHIQEQIASAAVAQLCHQGQIKRR